MTPPLPQLVLYRQHEDWRAAIREVRACIGTARRARAEDAENIAAILVKQARRRLELAQRLAVSDGERAETEEAEREIRQLEEQERNSRTAPTEGA